MSTFIYILYILLAIAVLLFMVLVHELGHYIAGRILKFKITEFSIGFGKAIFSRTNKRGEKISLRIFPLGGYCAFAGEGDDSETVKEGDFNAQKPWKRIIVFFAGVFMNFITAVVFSLILLCTYGGLDVVKVSEVKPEYSQTVVLKQGDVIYAFDDQKLDVAFGTTYNEALKYELSNASNFAKNEGKQITDYTFKMTVRHKDGTREEVDGVRFFALPKLDSDGNVLNDDDGNVTYEYTLGIVCEYYVYSFWEALARCWTYAFGLAWLVLKSLWLLITKPASMFKNAGGPIATIGQIASETRANPANLLILIPMLSANLAVFNILPFPALDGSHVLFTTIEWIRGKPINRKVESIIHFVGLCVLFAFVIIVDILHFALP